MTAPTLRPSLRANFGWLVAERGWRVAVGLVVSVMITRFLGPADFGLLAFAFSLNAIFGVVVSLGIDDVLARELVRRPDQARSLLWRGLRIKLAGAAVSFPLALLACWLFRPGDMAALALVAWVTAGLFFLPADVVELWYQSQERMRPPALVRQGALSVAALVRVALVIGEAPVWCFAAAVSLELALMAAAFAVLWFRGAKPSVPLPAGAVHPDAPVAKLLREGVPLLLSGFLVVITLHADRLLLIRLANENAAGLYAAAARMTELLCILPVALGAAFLPRLAALHASDPEGYARTARKAGLVLVAATVVIAALVAIAAPVAIPLILGEAYRSAAEVWRIHVWTLVLVAIVSLRSRLWVVEGRTDWILTISAATAVINIAANCWLIPRWGAVGAAWAGIIAWGASALVFPWCARGSARSMLVWCGLAKSA